MIDLDAINAALASGDMAIPPVGSVVEVRTSFSVRVVASVVREEPSILAGEPSMPWAVVSVSIPEKFFADRFVITPKMIVSVLSVPDTAPPFPEWTRSPQSIGRKNPLCAKS